MKSNSDRNCARRTVWTRQQPHPTNIAEVFEKRRLMQALNANALVAGRTGALSTQVIGRVDLRRWLPPKRGDRKRRISQLKVDLWVNSGSRGLHV